MANPFGNGDKGKRPTQTIEGTATEVAVEPTPEQKTAASGPEDGGDDNGPDREAEADSNPSQSAPPPRPVRSRVRGLVTHLAAGLFGGLVAIIALALAWSDLVTGTKPDVAALEQRLVKLEQAPRSSSDASAVSKLDERVATLEDGQKANAAKLSELANDISHLQASLTALSKVAEEGGSVAVAAAVSQQIAEAEKRLDAKIAAALAKGEPANTEDIQDLESELTELKAKLGALAEAMVGTGDAGALQPELVKLGERLAKIEALLPALAGAIEKEAAQAKSASLAIAFANLRAAVGDGRPYAAELDTLGALSPDVGDLGILPAYAETGIPTLSVLTRSFVAASDEALAVPAPEPEGSLVDSLMSSAQSLVKIKRLDQASSGQGASAAIARAKAALDNDDLAAAVRHVETLDGPAREDFATWLGQAHARLSAGDILSRLEGDLLVSMSGDAETDDEPQSP
jgi:hypothetical protein